MYRRIVNRHKLKKQIGRNIYKSRSFLHSLLHKEDRHRRDFSWQGREENPYATHENSTWKKKIYAITIVISLLLTICIGIYSNTFKIQHISIRGLHRISESDIRATIQGILNYKEFGLFPHYSYFISNIDEIKFVLKDRYPIEKIILEKKFPNNLNVTIEERLSTLIYDNGKEYSYIDLNGNFIETLRKVNEYEWEYTTLTTTSTNEQGEIEIHTEIVEQIHKPDIHAIIQELGDYPIVYDDAQAEDTQSQNDPVLERKTVEYIIDWYNSLKKMTQIQLKYFIIENTIGDITIQTYQGWSIKTRLDRPAETQIGELETILQEQLHNDIPSSYIDLRYADRIYWK